MLALPARIPRVSRREFFRLPFDWADGNHPKQRHDSCESHSEKGGEDRQQSPIDRRIHQTAMIAEDSVYMRRLKFVSALKPMVLSHDANLPPPRRGFSSLPHPKCVSSCQPAARSRSNIDQPLSSRRSENA